MLNPMHQLQANQQQQYWNSMPQHPAQIHVQQQFAAMQVRTSITEELFRSPCTVNDVAPPPLFHGMTIAVLNYDRDRAACILHAVGAYGGCATSSLTRQTTHVVTPHIEGLLLNVPCMTHYWLQDCLEAMTLLPLDGRAIYTPAKYVCGVPGMSDLIMSVTGFIGEERAELRALILACGAQYTGDLSKNKNTHLVGKRWEGEKYRKAVEWGVKCVSKSWLEECYRLGHMVHENACPSPDGWSVMDR